MVGKNAEVAATVANSRNNSRRQIRMTHSLFRARISVKRPTPTFTRTASDGSFTCGCRVLRNKAYCTTSVSGIECTKFTDVPVMVRLSVPERAGLLARIVRTAEPEPDTVVGFQDAETRAGTPLTLSETVPEKPCSAETVTVSEPFPPLATCSVVGEAESAKSPAELTTSVTFTE